MSPKKIAHLIIDDKFIDMAFREFEAVAPGQNQFVMLGEPRRLRHIKSEHVDFYSVRQAKRLIQSEECAAIVLHSLGDEFLPLLKDIPIGKKVIWLGWGYDYYDRLLSGAYPNGMLLPKSKDLLSYAPKLGKFGALASACKIKVNLSFGRSIPHPHELLRRIDYFSPVIDSEHQMACQLNPWFKPEYIMWNYGTVESDLGAAEFHNEELGGNILVGNSATIENNHLEIFDLLESHVNLTRRKLIVPLNYGEDWYKNKIIARGYEQFGDNFVPLTTFMPRDAYLELLQSCGHVFMNHLRQQALGNICIMMLKGAKIYMNPQSPLFRWLKAKGGVIESVESLVAATPGVKLTLQPLREQDRCVNHKVINEHWGQEIQRTKTRRLVDVAMGIV